MAHDTNSAVKKDNLLRAMNALKAFFFCFLGFLLFLLIYYNVSDRSGVVNTEQVIYLDHWTVKEPDGKEYTVDDTLFRSDTPYKGNFSVTTTLPEIICDNSVLCFSLFGSAEIYIDGELRKTYNNTTDVLLPGGQAKRFITTMPITRNDSGKQLVMVKNNPSKHPEVIPYTFITGVSGVYSEMFKRYGTSFVISALLLIFSSVVVIIGLCMRLWYHRSISMFHGALGVFTLAAWLVTNSFMYPFIFGHYHIDGILNYLLCLILPFGLILYVDSVQNGRYRKCFNILLLATAIDAVFWAVLHFTGLFPFNKALLYIDIILGILIAVVIGVLVVDFRRGYTRQYKYTFIGLVGFIFFCFLEIFFLQFLTLQQDDIPMLVGIMYFLVFIVLQQVDDLRKMNAEKQHAIDLSDAKTKFLANMSHEIRTPINSILGMNEMILRENKDKVINSYAKNVKGSGKMLLMLVNDVLDFSKIEAGKLEITSTEYSLTRLIADIINMFTERAHSKNLELLTEVDGEVPDGQIGDEVRIKQILVNLISNAVKYTDTGSVTLAVSGSYSGQNSFNLKLSVKDTGRGIHEDELASLFDAFQRADLKKNSSIEGTGLGLAIVKSIVNSMGGTIDVSSEYQKGSCFSVIIPVQVIDRTPVSNDFSNVQEEADEDYKCDYTAPDARVLAVDDNHSNLTIVRLFLKETGIVPDLCSNGTEAIKLCDTKKYDLILLDHMMPAPDGIETLKQIRNSDTQLNKDTPAIVLTANAIAGSRQLYMNAGFDDYLTKPLDSKQLEKTVKKYLPEDKVIPLKNLAVPNGPSSSPDDEYFVQEYYPIEDEVPEGEGSDSGSGKEAAGTGNAPFNLKDRLSVIKEMDFDSALTHCGGSEPILTEILLDIANESGTRIERMQNNFHSKDLDAYCIDAHAIKGLMATIGVDGLSDIARKHEYAARERDTLFIDKDIKSFLTAYGDLCSKLKALLS
ncbi:MAG: response regulator [Lachnospiraceae bacterium]|nr:response regulator [Lachnospiraceae bacterium]